MITPLEQKVTTTQGAKEKKHNKEDKMNTYQVEHKRPWYWAIKAYFTMPRLYVVTLKPKLSLSPDITMWSIKKNIGNVYLEASKLSDEKEAELFSVAEMSMRKILWMFLLSLLGKD